MSNPVRQRPIEILLVEDSPSDAQLLSESLRDYPLQTFALERAERLDEALALLARKPFDVVLLDLNLPDSSGLETCERMARAAGQAPVIVLTGADDEKIAAEALRVGVQDYLVKGQSYGGVIGRTIRYAVERSRAQQALRQSEAFTRKVLDSSINGLYIYDMEERGITFISPAYTHLTGYRLEDLRSFTGPRMLELFHPDDRDRVAAHIGAFRAAGEHQMREIEYRFRVSDGRWIWCLSRETVFARARDGSVRQYLGTFLDITKRKQAEEKQRESEARFRHLADAMPQLVWTADPDGRVDYYNERYKEFRGIAPTADGSFHWYLSRGTPVRDREGRIVKWFGTATDIDEVKRAEQTLRELTATLENKVAERTAELEHRARLLQKLALELSEAEDRERRRVAEILHDDLQQVLAAAKFHLNLMKHRLQYDPSLRATALQIDDMLKDAIEKSRSLSHELSPAVLHYSDWAEMLGWLANQVQAKYGLVVHVQAYGQVILHSDALKGFLYRAAQELLFNVVKHARVPEARVQVRRLGRYIGLSVSDRGRGFDVQALREAAGFGLLSLRERIELLGGRMKIKSVRGQDSTFVVVPDGETPADRRLRRENGEQPDMGTPSSVLRPPSSVLRVLVADDHEIVREGLISLLSEEQAVEVIGEATNGREAVDLAGRLQPDMVIMDVSMPLIDGDDATRQIKRHLPKTRVVALSMHAEPETIERMHRAGAESYVLKTASSADLLAAIRGKAAL